MPPRPAALPVIVDNIPAELRSRAQWVVWSYVWSESKGKYDKPPRQSSDLSPAKANDARTWGSFEDAIARYYVGEVDGVGFVPVDDGADEVLVGVDFDKCRDPETGEIAPWAAGWIKALATYVERSPSGTGVRMFAWGRLPPEGRKRGPIEVYQHHHYLTLTGQCLDGSPTTIEHRAKQLLDLHRHVWPEHHRDSGGINGEQAPAGDLDDDELLRRMFASKHGVLLRHLWDGGADGFPSDSEADLGFCSRVGWWVRWDKGRLDRLFRQSGRMRPKWDRKDYRERTLAKACDGKGGGYEPSRNGHHANNGDSKPAAAVSENLTDLGNAERLIRRHGADLRHCYPWKRWLCWDGRRWQEDQAGTIEAYATATARSIYAEAAACDDDDRRKALVRHASRSESAHSVRAMIELTRSQPGIPILPADMDRDPWALNVANGTLDLRTGHLRPHRREDLLTKLAPVTFDPAATCPLWDRCLDVWMDGNADLVDYLRRVIGYALTADVSEQVLFFLHGAGSNGKSTFLNIIREMLGDYAIQAVSELLTVKTHETHPTERADLFGRRFVATVETDEGKRMAESLMKQLTGGENLKARRMHQDFFEVPPTWTIFLASNHHPAIRGTDFAVWRRIRLIPFTVTIADDKKDKDLTAKLRAEFAGILAWAVRGCLEWQRLGLADPEEVTQATAEYQREQDSMSNFIAECCIVAEYARVMSSALLAAYQLWSGDKNMSRQELQKRLNDKGFQSKRGHGGHYFYHGIGLPADDPGEHG
jgi:putative DNA primase/helicase